MELIQLIPTLGAPASAAAVIMLLWRVSRTLDAQRQETKDLFHALDKRITVIEAKGK